MNSVPSQQRQITVGGDANGNVLVTGDGNIVIVQATKVIEESSEEKALNLDANPFVGLAAFTEQEGEYFFGRETLIEKLRLKYSKLYDGRENEGNIRLLPLLGPSGCGKSSVAAAGLIPELARQPIPGLNSQRIIKITPGERPLTSLAAVLSMLETNEDQVHQQAEIPLRSLQTPNTENEYDGLYLIVSRLPEIAQRPLLVYIDQFEEIYTLCTNDSERNTFIDNLFYAISRSDGRVSAIISMRSDFLGYTQTHSLLNQTITSQGFLIPAMDSHELNDAISKPFAMTGYNLDQSVVDLLIHETLGREGALPLLQFTLYKIWQGLASGRDPTDTLHELGGISGGIALEAERIFNNLSAADKIIAKRAFLGLVGLGEGMRDTRRRVCLDKLVSHSDSYERVHQVLRYFSRQGVRLITLFASKDGTTFVEITHEAILDNWGTFRSWIDERRAEIRFHQRITEATEHWLSLGKADGLLWRSPDLDLLKNYLQHSAEDLTSPEMAFANRSLKRQARTTFIRRLVVSCLILLSISLTVTTFYAIKQQQIARSGELVAKGNFVFNKDPKLAFRLAEAALKFAEIDDARNLLWAAYTSPLQQTLQGHTDGVLISTLSHNSRYLATASKDNSLILWETATGKIIETYRNFKLRPTSIEFSEDDKFLLIGTAYGKVHLAEVNRPSAPILSHDLSVHGHIIKSKMYLDGKILSLSEDSSIFSWSHTQKPEFIINLPSSGFQYADFSHDGKLIIAARRKDNNAYVWDLTSGKLTHTFEQHSRKITFVTFSPDKKYALTGSDDGKLIIWDLAKQLKPLILEGHTKGITSAKYNHNGTIIYSASANGETIYWNSSNGKIIDKRYGTLPSISDLAVEPEQNLLITVSEQSPVVQFWSIIPSNYTKAIPLGTTIDHIHENSDGRLMLLRTRGGHLGILDHEKRSFTLTGPFEEPVATAAFVNNGEEIIVRLSQSQKIITWDIIQNIHKKTLSSNGYKNTLLDDDGGYMIISSGDGINRFYPDPSSTASVTLEGRNAPLTQTFLSSDLKYLAAVDRNGAVLAWKTDDGTLLWQYYDPVQKVFDIVINKGGNDAYFIKGKSLYHYNNSNQKLINILDSNQINVASMQLSPDGERLAVATFDSKIFLLENTTHKIISSLIHQAKTTKLNFSPDSRLLLFKTRESINLVDSINGQYITKLQGHTSIITDSRFSRDGQHIYSTSLNKIMMIWPGNFKSILDVVNSGAQKTVRHLNSEEKQRFRLD